MRYSTEILKAYVRGLLLGYGSFHGILLQSNVLISDDGRALLTDFGFSLFGSVFSSRSPMRLGGVLNWMAPEILQEGGASAEADIWAFGMTALVCPSLLYT